MDLSKTPIRLMDAAITDRLRPAFPAKDFQIHRMPSVLTIDEFTRVVKLTPFIGLAWLGSATDREAGRVVGAAMRWRLVLVVKASSSLETRFKGDRRDIGLDAMVDVATAVLHGHSFTGIGACHVTNAEAVYAEGWGDMGTALAQLDFEIRYTLPLAALQLVSPDDFQQLGVEWLNPDSAEPDDGPALPQTIDLPQEDGQ